MGLTSCPLPLGNIRAPFLPVRGVFFVLLETLFFFAEVFLVLNKNHDEGSAGGGIWRVLERRVVSYRDMGSAV